MVPLSLPELLIGALSTYAISYYVTQTDGPFAVFLRLRRWAGAEVEAGGVPALGEVEKEQPPPGGLAALFSCPYCLSPYAAVVSLLLLLYVTPVAVLLGLAGGSVFLLNLGEGL